MYPPYQTEQDEINLFNYWRVLVRFKVLIISSTLIATILATIAAFLMTPIYRAQVLMAPVSDDQQNAMSGIASQFGGLASLAGINLGGGSGNTEEVLATLASRSFIGDFITDNQLIQVLYADKWDSTSNMWKSKSPDDIPTPLDAYSKFQKKILDINLDKKTGLVKLTIDWKDPQQAAAWANGLVNLINHHEKQLAIKEAEQSIAYLKEQLAKTSVVEMQQSIYQLMEAQTKKIMLANVRDQYAFKIIDPAVVPEKKLRPNRKLIILSGLLLGLGMGVILALLISSIKKQREESNNENSR